MENKDYNAAGGDYTSPEQDYSQNYGNPYSAQYDSASYGNNQYSSQSYENAQYSGQSYGNAQYGGQSYGNNQYNSPPYGNAQYANIGGTPVDAAGNPLKSHFALQLVFAIIEIVCCCLSPIAMILGIIALVFAVQANTAYNQGRGEEFKAKSKTTNILLIIGGVLAAISLILNIAVVAFIPQILEETYDYIEEYEDEMFDDYFNHEDNEFYDEYIGSNEKPLIEGYNHFTLNGMSYEVPMTYDTFVQMGYEIDSLEAGLVFEAETFEYYNIYDANHNWVGSIRISNDTENNLSVEECLIDYIQLFNDAAYDTGMEALNLTFGNGLDINASYDELKAWLGEPYYISEETMSGATYQNYTWQYDGDNQYQCIDIYFIDGVISEVVIEEFEWVY